MRIDEMAAGREMDALVAEKVMGWEIELNPIFVGGIGLRVGHGTTKAITTFAPSIDIAAAWEVVVEMKKQGWSFRFGNNAWAKEQNAAAFFHAVKGIGRDILTGDYVYEENTWAIGNTESLAICRAALKSVGVAE